MSDSRRRGPDDDAGSTWVLVTAIADLIVFMAVVAVATVPIAT